VFDFDLQLKFWRGMTDAMLHGTQATLAAASSFQDHVLAHDAARPETGSRVANRGARPYSVGLWWLGPWQALWTGNAGSQFRNPYASLFPMMDPSAWTTLFSPTAWPTVCGTSNQWPQWGQGPAAALGPLASIWPWSTMGWAAMQTPFTAMLVSAGMPYKVASPSAKASTAALDAAHAARQQMDKVYSAYRSDGGHAAAQIVMMPWALAASLMEAAQSQNVSASGSAARH
jgi:hypothetical protein